MQIRRLIPDDTPAYREMMLKAYELHPDAFTSSVAERAAKPMSWWESRLNSNPPASEVVIGALIGNSLVGVAGIAFETREKARHKATVFGTYVARESRGTGAGRKLLNELLSRARNRSGTRIVQLTVTQGNKEAERLYADGGFQQFGIEPFAVRVQETYVSKIHMWCDLNHEKD